VLSVDGVAQRLDDRFRLLTGGPRTALPRQQTLRAAMDWSYSLLAPVEQALLRRLAVFSGGFSLEAAESVCTGGDLAAGEVLDRLGGLIEKSLLTLHDRDAASRYGMLETIRQYARERLAESGQESELLERHAFYFAAFAEEAGQGLVGADQSAWMSRVQADLDNIRAAMLWARQSDAVEVGFRLASPIWRFWMLSGQSAEGRRWLNALMAVDRGVNVPSSIRAGAFLAAGALAYSQGDHTSAKQLYAECLLLRRELGDLAGVAEALNGLGVAQQQLGEYRQAEQRFEESVRLRSEIGDVFGCHAPLSNLGILARYCGEYSRAAEMYERALAIQRQFGHTQAVVNSLNNLAQLWGDRGEYERARIMSQEALTMARDGGLVRQVVIALNTQAAQAIEQGELDTAEAHLNECLELARSTGDKTEENTTITNLAEVALGRGDPDRATQLAERALTALQQIGHRRGQAFALLALSEAARIRGEYDRAAALLDECVELRQGLGDTLGTIFTLESRARLAVNRGANEEAVRLFGSAARLRRVLETPLPPLWQAEYAQSIAHLREMLDRDAYATLWGEGESHAATFLSTGNATAQVYEIETSRGVRIETVAAEEA
ncbi:MAG TPA: tetratricopeptide repeat protein, partial [Chloroflexota bacterium]